MEDWSASGRTETALVLLIPEAERVVGGWRARYDPAAGSGVPAHVTLLYPFLPPQRLTSEVLADLRQHFAEEPPLSLEFSGICAFPNALYLAPELIGQQDASVRSDIYSIGVLLYHLLTGSYPVRARNRAHVHLVSHTVSRGGRIPTLVGGLG